VSQFTTSSRRRAASQLSVTINDQASDDEPSDVDDTSNVNVGSIENTDEKGTISASIGKKKRKRKHIKKNQGGLNKQ
jgi:hypothetical protein